MLTRCRDDAPAAQQLTVKQHAVCAPRPSFFTANGSTPQSRRGHADKLGTLWKRQGNDVPPAVGYVAAALLTSHGHDACGHCCRHMCPCFFCVAATDLRWKNAAVYVPIGTRCTGFLPASSSPRPTHDSLLESPFHQPTPTDTNSDTRSPTPSPCPSLQ